MSNVSGSRYLRMAAIIACIAAMDILVRSNRAFVGDAQWNEADHPRDEDGKFGKGGGGGNTAKLIKGFLETVQADASLNEALNVGLEENHSTLDDLIAEIESWDDPESYIEETLNHLREFSKNKKPEQKSSVEIGGHEVKTGFEAHKAAPIGILSIEEEESLRFYTSNDYRAINEPLRNGTEPTEQARNHIEMLDSILSRSSVTEDILVYRGIGTDKIGDDKKPIEEGMIFTDNGFVSTSTDEMISSNFKAQGGKKGIMLVMRIPKGTRAASVARYSGSRTEDEILIARGTTFKVASREGNTFYVEVFNEQER